MTNLIDTTEMYLKAIYELKEDGVPPLRARIVERLDHSGPTVSQTVGRMERDGLLRVARDRQIELTQSGLGIAIQVVRKHRIAERLLMDVIGIEWTQAHEEACRWEHVMSDRVEARLLEMLGNPKNDPYGNPIPESDEFAKSGGVNLLDLVATQGNVVGLEVLRIGEPIQAETHMLELLWAAGVVPGSTISVESGNDAVVITSDKLNRAVRIPEHLALHFFVSEI